MKEWVHTLGSPSMGHHQPVQFPSQLQQDVYCTCGVRNYLLLVRCKFHQVAPQWQHAHMPISDWHLLS